MLTIYSSLEQKIGRTDLVQGVRELPADLETPTSVYLKLSGHGPSFLLESVTGGEQVARYSFIGADLDQAFVLRGRVLERHGPQGISVETIPDEVDPLESLRDALACYQARQVVGLPRFTGGLVGFLGYEAAHFFEPSVPTAAPNPEPEAGSGLPEAIFLLANNLVAFDHAYGRLLLIVNVPLEVDGEGENQPRAGDKQARAGEMIEARLDALQRRLEAPLPARPHIEHPQALPKLASNTTRAAFHRSVLAAKDLIAAGEIFQVVLSQRFSRRSGAAPFEIYRALRRLNPSPYMFFFDFDRLAGGEPLRLIGASPEMHVRLEGRQASLRPIAGTRPRGSSPGEDAGLERELLADPKERAEHIMLVDLARNDLGRVCEYGSVEVPELMGVERYSHVMHIVSQVEGRLRPELDGFDLLRATFPAGTVSGAPKIRAMQIISGLERSPRGPYAGAVGYFSYDGSLDTCITIRTLVMQGETVSIQAGAGIVADSDPDREYQETINKASALAVAVEMAELG
jgi:anthranilate synthase component 1